MLASAVDVDVLAAVYRWKLQTARIKISRFRAVIVQTYNSTSVSISFTSAAAATSSSCSALAEKKELGVVSVADGGGGVATDIFAPIQTWHVAEDRVDAVMYLQCAALQSSFIVPHS